jgi:hypothetical protein
MAVGRHSNAARLVRLQHQPPPVVACIAAAAAVHCCRCCCLLVKIVTAAVAVTAAVVDECKAVDFVQVSHQLPCEGQLAGALLISLVQQRVETLDNRVK